jgi:hypothetical protein
MLHCPRSGSSQLIPSDAVAAARRYKAAGFDVARFGDDRTVIGLRQGRRFEILGKYRGMDTVETSARVVALIESHKPDATVVDGDGLGAGVVDQLRHRGFQEGLFEFHGGARAFDSDAYYNRRAECWSLMGAWLKEGAEIPDDPEMEVDLTGP